MNSLLKDCVSLFLLFCKIGAVTFGGGYAMYPILLQELTIKRDWLDETELFDYFAVAQTLPGVIAINASCFIGFRRRRYAGAAAAALGVIFPSLIVIIIVASFVTAFNEIEWVKKMFRGINIGVAVTLCSTLIKTSKNSIKNVFCALQAVAAFVAVAFFNVSIVIIIIIGIVTGIAYYGIAARIKR